MPAIVYQRPTAAAKHRLNITVAGCLSTFEAHVSTKWFYAAELGPLDITPGSETDALVARLFERMKDARGIGGHTPAGQHTQER